MDKVVAEVHQRYKESTAHLRDWFEEAEESLKYYSGDQWPEDDRFRLEEQDRPVTTFNRIAPFLDAVAGMEVNNRKEVRYLPREEGDAGANDLLTGAAEWARDGADAEDEESQAFTNMLVTGMGWIESSVEHADDPDGEITMRRRDPFRMRYDTSANKRNLADARWVMYISDMTAEEIHQKWGVKIDDKTKGPWDSDIDDLLEKKDVEIEDGSLDAYLQDDEAGPEPVGGTIRVARYQYVTYKPFIRVATMEGIKEYSTENWPKVQQQLAMSGTQYKHIRQQKKVIKQAYVVGGTLLEHDDAPVENLFNFSAITGKYDEIKGYFYGLVRSMKDPQRWANVFLSSILDTLMSNSKGGLMAEEGAATDPRKLEETWSDPNKVTWLAPGAIAQGKVQAKPTAAYPQGMDRLMQFAIQSFPEVTGISMEMLGLVQHDQPGIVETSRKQSALNVLAWAFDSLRRYRKHQGRVLASLIVDYIADGRLVRIMGKASEQYVPLLRNQLDFRYDVIVDEAPTSPNQRERTFQVLTQLLPMIQQLGVPIPPDLLKYAPLPESMIQQWLQHIDQVQEQARTPDPIVERIKESAALDKEAEARKDMADADKKVAEAEQTRIENQILLSTGMMP